MEPKHNKSPKDNWKWFSGPSSFFFFFFILNEMSFKTMFFLKHFNKGKNSSIKRRQCWGLWWFKHPPFRARQNAHRAELLSLVLKPRTLLFASWIELGQTSEFARYFPENVSVYADQSNKTLLKSHICGHPPILIKRTSLVDDTNNSLAT